MSSTNFPLRAKIEALQELQCPQWFLDHIRGMIENFLSQKRPTIRDTLGNMIATNRVLWEHLATHSRNHANITKVMILLMLDFAHESLVRINQPQCEYDSYDFPPGVNYTYDPFSYVHPPAQPSQPSSTSAATTSSTPTTNSQATSSQIDNTLSQFYQQQCLFYNRLYHPDQESPASPDRDSTSVSPITINDSPEPKVIDLVSDTDEDRPPHTNNNKFDFDHMSGAGDSEVPTKRVKLEPVHQERDGDTTRVILKPKRNIKVEDQIRHKYGSSEKKVSVRCFDFDESNTLPDLPPTSK